MGAYPMRTGCVYHWQWPAGLEPKTQDPPPLAPSVTTRYPQLEMTIFGMNRGVLETRHSGLQNANWRQHPVVPDSGDNNDDQDHNDSFWPLCLLKQHGLK